MAQPYFDEDRRNLADQRRNEMIAETDGAHGRYSCNNQIRRIGNGPGDGYGLNGAVFIQFIRQVTPFYKLPSLIPQDSPHDDEAEDISQYLPYPGEEDPRYEAKNCAADRQKGNRRQARYVTNNNHKGRNGNRTIAKRTDIFD